MDDVLKAENDTLRDTLQLIADGKITDAKACAEIAAGTLAAIDEAAATAPKPSPMDTGGGVKGFYEEDRWWWHERWLNDVNSAKWNG